MKIHVYKPEFKRGDGAVVIFPGGGYSHRSYHEGETYALKINEMGLVAIVADYSVAPDIFPAPFNDGIEALRLARETVGVDPKKIAVMGSSAGGHLAALLSTMCEEADRPNAQILCYPVTDIESHRGSYENLLGGNIAESEAINPIALADELTPRTFIWHTSSDEAVDVKGTYKYAARLSELNIPVEMHIYPVGCHGLGLATGDPKREPVEYVQRWIEDLERWLKLIGFINQ